MSLIHCRHFKCSVFFTNREYSQHNIIFFIFFFVETISKCCDNADCRRINNHGKRHQNYNTQKKMLAGNQHDNNEWR